MDGSNPTALLRALLPKVPLIGKTAVFHTFGLSATSSKWDLRTELTVKIVRSFLDTPTPQPLSKTQKFTIRDPGIKGKLWVNKVTLPRPQEDDVRDALLQAIESLKTPGQAGASFPVPDLLSVTAEWTGYRADATHKSPELDVSEMEKYARMMKEVQSNVTVLYFHGGAYYLLDPATYRPSMQKLAELTKGRCFSVRYRLAPQNPFPAAILDALHAYLSLLYPAPDALHTAVPASQIVVSGDSAGGNLAITLLQTILELRRLNRKILFNGVEREVPVPAGVACNSGWFDQTVCMPSTELNADYDYLPPPSARRNNFPKCDIWPTTPPRRNIYTEDAYLCHPLVSPMAAESWEGSCPLWIETGQELLTDEDKYVAKLAASQGVPVIYEEYEAMPHVFAMMLEGHAASRRCFAGWAKFISDAVERPSEMKTRGIRIAPKTLTETEVDVSGLSPCTREEILVKMKESVAQMQKQSPIEGESLAKL